MVDIRKRNYYEERDVMINHIREEHTSHSIHYINLVFPVDKCKNGENTLRSLIEKEGISILTGFIFIPEYFDGIGVNRQAAENIFQDIPLNYLSARESEKISVQIIGVTGAEVISFDTVQGAYGRYFTVNRVSYYFFTNYSNSQNTSNGEKAYNLFCKLQDDTIKQGITFKNVIRTWIFLDNILTWYNDFNSARSRFFKENEILTDVVPSSTGIGIGNPSESSLVISGYAVRSDHPGLVIRVVPSPFQCPAINYSSSFSRAVEIKDGKSRRLLISGTASIDRRGITLHKEDIESQIVHTMRVVEAILESRKFSWKNMVRSIAYFSDAASIDIFLKHCKENSIDPGPILMVIGTICRDDLLFEIEVDAIT
ncbi:MAG TPA: hypothetical protein VMW76_06540 [Bacteroidales bacterium]|nr:hypothetical protein [Bacteroidales bacterium]